MQLCLIARILTMLAGFGAQGLRKYWGGFCCRSGICFSKGG